MGDKTLKQITKEQAENLPLIELYVKTNKGDIYKVDDWDGSEEIKVIIKETVGKHVGRTYFIKRKLKTKNVLFYIYEDKNLEAI